MDLTKYYHRKRLYGDFKGFDEFFGFISDNVSCNK